MDTNSILKLDLAELRKQVAQERAAILAAPRVESVGYVNRCHFCGQLARTGSTVERHGGDDDTPTVTYRWRGECCGG